MVWANLMERSAEKTMKKMVGIVKASVSEVDLKVEFGRMLMKVYTGVQL